MYYPVLFNFHLLPPQFLTPLQLSILPSTVLFPRSPSLHTALPSLPYFLELLDLAGEGEREETGGWRREGSEFPALAPSPLLPGSSHGQVLLQVCFLEEGLLPSLPLSAAFSVYCHTPPLQTSGGDCSRPGKCLDLNASACFFSPCLPF